MRVTDQIKILNRKIKQNESQYDLDRKAAKISVLSSNNLDNKYEYSPLGKMFNKGLSEEDKREGILKRLENIKDKNDELLNIINTTNKSPKNKMNIQSKNLIDDNKHILVKYKDIDDIEELSLDSLYKKLNNLMFISLKNVASRKKEKKELKNKVLSNAENLYNKLFYIYKDKYNQEINTLDIKNKEKLDYKKLRLSDY